VRELGPRNATATASAFRLIKDTLYMEAQAGICYLGNLLQYLVL